MRERLIELVKRGDKTFAEKYAGKVMLHIDELYDFIADHILADGWIRPPVKVGQTIYFLGGIDGKLIQSATVEEIIVTNSGARELLVITENGIAFDDSLESFFLTREEAEAKLKEGVK